MTKPRPPPNHFHVYADKIFLTLKMESGTFLQNISANLQTYMMSQPRRLSSHTPGTKAWEPILSGLVTTLFSCSQIIMQDR